MIAFEPLGNALLGKCWGAGTTASLDRLEDDELGSLTRYQKNPVGFCREILGVRLWRAQRDILNDLVHHDRVTVRSCRGAGKCVEENERLILADGRVARAGDLVGRFFSVIAFEKDGSQVPRLAWATDNGEQPVYEVVTNRGRRILRTGNHPLIVADLATRCPGGAIFPLERGWTPVEEIEPGQAVLVPMRIGVSGFRPIPDSHVKLLGYLLGDGGTTRSVEFDQADGPPKDEFCKIVEELGATPRRISDLRVSVSGRGDAGPKRGFVSAGRNPVLNLCREWGIFGKKSKEKAFPDLVWELPNKQIALLLNRLFACDGWVHIRPDSGKSRHRATIGIALASEQLIRDVELALLRLGISASRIRRRLVACDGGEKRFTCWELTIELTEQVRRFAEIVGIYGKDEKVARALAEVRQKKTATTLQWPWLNCPDDYQWEKVESVTLVGERPTVAITVDQSETFLTTFVEHNTRVAACAAVWLLLCFPGSVVITTAPTYPQVKELLWREIHDLHDKALFRLPGKLTEVRWDLGGKWFALGRATDESERFAGFHASPIGDPKLEELSDDEFWALLAEDLEEDDAGLMAVIVDEASGVAQKTFDVAKGFLTTHRSKELWISNPTQVGGPFYDSHDLQREKAIRREQKLSVEQRRDLLWRRHKISAFDVRREAPRLMSENYIAKARIDWGEGNPMWQAYVEGEFPVEGPYTLFALANLEKCGHRTHDFLGEPLKGQERDQQGKLIHPCVFGVDFGAQGEGESGIAVRRGDYLIDLICWREEDTTRTEERIYDAFDKYNPVRVQADGSGIGKSICDRLRQGLPTRPGGPRHKPLPVLVVDTGTAAKDTTNFVRIRSEWYWALHLRIKAGRLSGLKDDRLKAQLSPLTWKLDAGNKIQVETKEEIAKSGRVSPDRADCLMLSFGEQIPQTKVSHGTQAATLRTARW